MKKTIVLILLLLVLIGAIVGVKGLQIAALIEVGENFVEPPVTISTVDVKPYEWESTLTAVGSLEAAKGLLITADLSGRITKINFAAGSQVSAGDLLVEQETTTERAQLRSANAAAALAKSNFDRIKQLYQRKVASKSEYDNANNTYLSALAESDNIRAAIEKKSIRAPFDGRLGIRLVNLGQTINAGEPVVSLQAADQMFVNFFLPQQNLSQLKTGFSIRLTTDAVPNKTFTGKINAINPEIDTATRSVEVQAILANPNNELSPGMFASIEVLMPEVKTVLLVPTTAVQYATYGNSIFTVEEADNNHSGTDSVAVATHQEKQLIARQKFVRLGEARGDYVVVTKGLVEGEQVVSAGVFKLRNGAAVVINNAVVPDYSLSPELRDQ